MKTKTIFKSIWAVILSITVIMAGILWKSTVPAFGSESSYTGESMIKNIYTNKAMYDPGENVYVTMTLENTTKTDIQNGKLVLQGKNLNQEVGEPIVETYNLSYGSTMDVVIE